MNFAEALAAVFAGGLTQRKDWLDEHTIPATELNTDFPVGNKFRVKQEAIPVRLNAYLYKDASGVMIKTVDGRKIPFHPTPEDISADDWQQAKD